MRERPILFSGPMVRAILAGEKTVTRRAVKWRVTMFPEGVTEPSDHPGAPTWEPHSEHVVGHEHPDGTIFCGAPVLRCPALDGDRLWVRETWLPHEHDDHADIATYRADHADGPVPEKVQQYREVRGRWKSGRSMPRIASRITLEVVDVRIERLHAIDDADALREGVKHYDPVHLWDVPEPPFAPREVFTRLWCAINGDASWRSNPWVWRIEFKRVEVRDA